MTAAFDLFKAGYKKGPSLLKTWPLSFQVLFETQYSLAPVKNKTIITLFLLNLYYLLISLAPPLVAQHNFNDGLFSLWG
ncbi:hypothetical protein D3H55_10615 [Bacillus salacetis]|uniref:Uncharacterized protein n=1 Tax=Bacillus salacetis TaxID=2315464 RepID=A0A3A1QYI3_9BACI|nr:hypothetical protein [Bacillus salacetis]RIW34040.1 hypothetical protein D3H55_10615 [Bacillus salacetis]